MSNALRKWNDIQHFINTVSQKKCAVEIKAQKIFYQGQSKENCYVFYALSNHFSRKVN